MSTVPTIDIFARNWWMLLIRGIFAIVLGILAFAWPGVTLVSLVLLFGVYAILDGITALVISARARFWWLILTRLKSLSASEELPARDFLNILRGERELDWTFVSPSARSPITEGWRSPPSKSCSHLLHQPAVDPCRAGIFRCARRAQTLHQAFRLQRYAEGFMRRCVDAARIRA